MKNLLTLIFATIVANIAMSQTTTEQEDVTRKTSFGIDPRQYITVKYSKIPASKVFDTIWNWETRNNVPQQKFSYLNTDGEIQIHFDKIGLINNINFEGMISLEAEVSGASGTRKIEVNPYSEIGVGREPIGIKSEPPSEIAKKLLNLILSLEDSYKIYNDLNRLYYYSSINFDEKTKEIKDLSDAIKRHISNNELTVPELKNKIIELRYFVTKSSHIGYDYRYDSVGAAAIYNSSAYSDINALNTQPELLRKLNEISNDYSIIYDKQEYNKLMKKAVKEGNIKLNSILNYLESFDNGGEDASRAFLSLINKDIINYTELKGNFKKSQEKLIRINFEATDQNELYKDLKKNEDFIFDAWNSIMAFTTFKGSKFQAILDDLEEVKISEDYSSRYFYLSGDYKDQQQYFSKIKENMLFLTKQLSQDAAQIIFRKLVLATIDLGKSGANNGEVLNIYITWIQNGVTGTAAKSPRLPIGKYYLRETGWRTSISDMFTLIERIDEDEANPETVSPSNFKGSGGVVLAWTYHKEDSGLKITNRGNDVYSVKRRNQLMNFLEPSIGVNVSYLDFSTASDVEIGVGAQLGLFNNKIFFGYGVNLHMLSPHDAPQYFFLGFSFARLSDLFQSKSGTANN